MSPSKSPAVRRVVKDVVSYLQDWTVGPTLAGAAETFDRLRIRLMCIQLASWWNRGTLMNSRHPYIWFKERAKTFDELIEFVAAVPALNEFLRCDKDGCYFRDEVTRDEMKAINDYAMEHYRPQVFR